MKESLVRMCQNPDISVLDKLRLLMIYIISQSAIQEATRKELMKNIDTRLQRAVLTLDKLGVDLAFSKKKGRPKHNKTRLSEFEKRAKTIPMALMRYVPMLHQVLTELCGNSLSEEDFPYTAPPPADYGKRKAKAKGARGPRNWRGKDSKEEAKEDTRPYFIVYMLGGVTFSELRCMYEIAANAQVNLLIGSTSILRPAEFIRQLAGLNTKQFHKAVLASGGKRDDADELPDINPKDKEEGSDDEKDD
jgi:syntaxin-binding protein 1